MMFDDRRKKHFENSEKYFFPTMTRAYKYYRRWDEGLWRILELTALANVLVPKEYQSILDLGCGNGDLFEAVFGGSLNAYGIDTSENNVSEAKASGRYISVVNEDACSMSFSCNSFDLVFSNSVLEHIDDVDSVLSEVSRILMPSGKFIFTTPTPLLYSRKYYYWRNKLSLIGLDWVGQRMAQREKIIYHHVNILPFIEWEHKLINAGFKSVTKYDYITKKSAQIISKYSGVSRYSLLLRIVKYFDTLILNSNRNWPAEKWVNWYHTALKPYLIECSLGEEGCGQVIIAQK